jgi:hypothetical protein
VAGGEVEFGPGLADPLVVGRRAAEQREAAAPGRARQHDPHAVRHAVRDQGVPDGGDVGQFDLHDLYDAVVRGS